MNKTITGVNDLATCRPDLAKEWDFSKNKGLTPYTVSKGSSQKIWWLCPKGHSYQTVVYNRNDGRGCPYCSGRLVLPGFNDLATTEPDIAAEWDNVRNGELKPTMITRMSSKSVYWKCSVGHSWKTKVYSRSMGRGCPHCSKNGTSIAEQGVAYYVGQAVEIQQRVKDFGREIDVYIPKHKIAIEYDGEWCHHNRKRKDAGKERSLTQKGITAIRLIESRNNEVKDNHINYRRDNRGPNYEWALKELFNLLFNLTKDEAFKLVDIDMERDRLIIRERIAAFHREQSVAELYPNIAKDWDYDKNGSLLPEMAYAHSNEQFYWKCSRGHSWKASVYSRTQRKCGCPICSNHTIIPGVNDLATVNPMLAKEWDYENNGDLKPTDVAPSAKKEVYWKCKKGHRWPAKVATRARGVGCPICANKVVMPGFNDLATKQPELAKEWAKKENGKLKPSMFSEHSGQKVFWKCKDCGNVWEASINNRSNGSGCPACRYKRK